MKDKKTEHKVIKAKRELREDEVRKAFKSHFVKLKRSLKLDASLEEVIWLHLKATGNDKPELFERGVRHFGYKI